MNDKNYTIYYQELGTVWVGIEHAKTLLGAKRIARRWRVSNETITITERYSTDILAKLSPTEKYWKNY